MRACWAIWSWPTGLPLPPRAWSRTRYASRANTLRAFRCRRIACGDATQPVSSILMNTRAGSRRWRRTATMSDLTVPFHLPVNVEQIQQLLPHRYPFLLVDRVIELVPNKSAVAIKNVTINKPFFQGHFPGHPVMTGVLIVEAMAQAAGLLTQISSRLKGTTGSPLFYLAKVDNARFNAPVVPGDQLRLEVTLKRLLRSMGLFEARTMVGDKEVASCELMCAARSDK